VHSNAIYIDKNGRDVIIHWKGVDYEFRHLRPVEFITYELILQLYDDLMDSIEEILAHKLVAVADIFPDRLA